MLNNGSLEHTFLRLWASRFDVYAEQQSNGSYLKVEESLTAEVIKRHLRQEITVGFYQLDKNNMVKWLCWDLDPEKLDDPLLTAKTIILKRPDSTKKHYCLRPADTQIQIIMSGCSSNRYQFQQK